MGLSPVLENNEVMFFNGLTPRWRPATRADHVKAATHTHPATTTPTLDPADDAPETSQALRPEVERAIDRVIANAERLRTAFDDVADSVLTPEMVQGYIPRFPRQEEGPSYQDWTSQERSLLAAVVQYYYSRALAAQDNPEPQDAERSDARQWLRMFKAGIPIGQHRAALSKMPQAQRAILEDARMSGNEVLLPHPASSEPLPRHLRVEEIMRRFGVERSTAEQFQLYFLILELSPEAIDNIAKAVRLWTKTDTLTPEQLSHRRSDHHPDVLLLQYHRLCAELLALEPDDEEILDAAVRHFDTDLGRRDPNQVALEYDADEEIPERELDLITTESDDEDALDPEEELEASDGHTETIAYHRVGHGDCESIDTLDADPLYQQITTAGPADVAHLKMLLYHEQHAQKAAQPNTTKSPAKPLFRSYTHWTYLWVLLKAREKHYQDVTLKRLIAAIESCGNYHALKQMGARMFPQLKPWPQAARKKYWAAYNQRKAEMERRLKIVPRSRKATPSRSAA